MDTVKKITELINKYDREVKQHYKVSGRLELERENSNSKFSYNEGANDNSIMVKEKFIEELEELKEYCGYV